MRWARQGGHPVLVAQNGAVLTEDRIYKETLSPPEEAPDFVVAALRASASGYMDDALCSTAEQLEAHRWTSAAGHTDVSDHLQSSGCYIAAAAHEATAAPTTCPASPVNDTTPLANVTGDHDGKYLGGNKQHKRKWTK